MGKNKLARFAENLTFPNMFQFTFRERSITPNHFLKGKWNEDFFHNNNPITLELGCGRGEYTIGLAKRHPNINFIGIDIKGARMWRGCKTSNEEKMPNVAFLRMQIQDITACFSENEIQEIWITFPDPQPKKPNKRLSSERFLRLYTQVLKPNGIVHLKTDSLELHEYTLYEVLRSHPEYNILFHTTNLYKDGGAEDAMTIQTYYESLFSAQGKPITYLKFQI